LEHVEGHDQSLIWCHLNAEGDRLAESMSESVQVSGGDRDEYKEEMLLAFANGEIRRLITKPKIASFGLNFQSCAHMTFFPSHSYEQYYQGVRRCWRFGQTRPVTVDVIASEGESGVIRNLQRKSRQADEMFTHLVALMNDPLHINNRTQYQTGMETPNWLMQTQ